MSFEEPKAPIVRIRKKKVKKKSKDNDVVILPVRASQNPRYSTLAPPQNPQTKGRECCRHVFSGCMKIPVCKLICFRCILPQCYSGNYSDEEEVDIKDEGYHSQNRRSSEILPLPEAGAQGGSNTHTVEMTDIKSETVTLIPPPRTHVNDYRKEPNRGDYRERLGASATGGACCDDGEVTYIEVESVSLQDSEPPTKHTSHSSGSIEKLNVKLDGGYEEPVQAGILAERLVVNFESELLAKYESVHRSEMAENQDDDGGNSDDSESKYYVNEDVLKPRPDTQCDIAPVLNSSEVKQYMNLDTFIPMPRCNTTHSSSCSLTSAEDAEDVIADDTAPHEYVNLKPLEDVHGTQTNIISDASAPPLADTNRLVVDLTPTASTASAPSVNQTTPVKLEVNTNSDDADSTHGQEHDCVVLKIDEVDAADDQSKNDHSIDVSDSTKLVVCEKVSVKSDSTDTSDDDVGEATGDQTKLI